MRCTFKISRIVLHFVLEHYYVIGCKYDFKLKNHLWQIIDKSEYLCGFTKRVFYGQEEILVFA